MLKALYDYGIRNGLAIPPGFMRKPIRAYILLSAAGDYLGIQQCESESRVCPDIGSLANSPDKCNPLAEKLEIILSDDGRKTEFFHRLLREGSEHVPQLRLCLDALETPQVRRVIQDEAKNKKLKGMDRISFKVDDEPIVELPAVKDWWGESRKQFAKAAGKSGGENKTRCLITGELTTPLETVPTVTGLQSVGGHSRGEALICFDKAAFQSYGLKKSANAPVSEEAFAVVKDALNDLLEGSPAMYRRDKNRAFNPTAPIFAGMKFVHWFDCALDPQDDPVLTAFGGLDWGDAAEQDDAPDEAAPVTAAEAENARRQANRLIESLSSGVTPPPSDCQYHILLISGANGRAMIRRYEHGNYETLRRNLALWNKDLALCDDFGRALIKPRKLTARLMRLIKNSRPENIMEQLKKELAGITPTIVLAIINGTALPDAVAARALAYIRSQVYKDENFIPDGVACQWVKAWLARKGGGRNEEVSNMTHFNPDYPNEAYHCGALTAIYADLQRAAMGDKLNSTVVTRYYASASQTPSMVLGRLERMTSVAYLSKLSEGLAHIYEDRLNKEYAFFDTESGRTLPKTLNLEQQSYFALGYRQMCAQIAFEKQEAKNKNKEDK